MTMRTTVVAWAVVALVPIVAAQSTEKERRQAIDYLQKGQDYFRNEKFDQAADAFRRAAALDPLLELAHYGLGQVAMATKQYPAAVRAYTACRDAYEKNVAEAMTSATIADRRIEDQIRSLNDTIMGLSRGRLQTRNTDATIAQLRGQMHELESRRRRTSEAPQPTPPWISIALGSAYFRTNAMVDAEREYRAALAADSGLGEGHNNLAVVLMLTGRYDEADKEVRAAEQAGFAVNPQFKADLAKRRGGGGR